MGLLEIANDFAEMIRIGDDGVMVVFGGNRPRRTRRNLIGRGAFDAGDAFFVLHNTFDGVDLQVVVDDRNATIASERDGDDPLDPTVVISNAKYDASVKNAVYLEREFDPIPPV